MWHILTEAEDNTKINEVLEDSAALWRYNYPDLSYLVTPENKHIFLEKATLFYAVLMHEAAWRDFAKGLQP